MLPPQMKGIAANPQYLRNQIEIHKAEVKLHEREIFTLGELGKAERAMWRATAPTMQAEQFSLAHKAHESAVLEIKRMELSKLKAQLAISEAMLAEAEKVMQAEGGNK